MYVKQALDKFGKSLVKQSRSNLTRKKKNVSKDLYKSIDYDVKVHKNSFEFSLSMEDYGKFIDKGVKGSKDSKKAPNSPYSYKTKMPPAKVFDKWSIRRGIAPRDSKGKFVSRKSVNFAIARSVFLYGIETTNFLTRPFEQAFKKLPNQIIEAYSLDVDSFLKSSLE